MRVQREGKEVAEERRWDGDRQRETEVTFTCWWSCSGLCWWCQRPISQSAESGDLMCAEPDSLQWGVLHQQLFSHAVREVKHTSGRVSAPRLPETKLPPLPFNPMHQLSVKTSGKQDESQRLWNGKRDRKITHKIIFCVVCFLNICFIKWNTGWS